MKWLHELRERAPAAAKAPAAGAAAGGWGAGGGHGDNNGTVGTVWRDGQQSGGRVRERRGVIEIAGSHPVWFGLRLVSR